MKPLFFVLIVCGMSLTSAIASETLYLLSPQSNSSQYKHSSKQSKKKTSTHFISLREVPQHRRYPHQSRQSNFSASSIQLSQNKLSPSKKEKSNITSNRTNLSNKKSSLKQSKPKSKQIPLLKVSADNPSTLTSMHLMIYESNQPYSKELRWLQSGNFLSIKEEQLNSFEKIEINQTVLYVVPRNTHPLISSIIQPYYDNKKGWILLIDKQIYLLSLKDKQWKTIVLFYTHLRKNETQFLTQNTLQTLPLLLPQQVTKIASLKSDFSIFKNLQKKSIHNYLATIWWNILTSYQLQEKKELLDAINTKLLSQKESYTNRVLLVGISESLYYSSSLEMLKKLMTYKSYLYQSLFSLSDVNEFESDDHLIKLIRNSFDSNLIALYS